MVSIEWSINYDNMLYLMFSQTMRIYEAANLAMISSNYFVPDISGQCSDISVNEKYIAFNSLFMLYLLNRLNRDYKCTYYHPHPIVAVKVLSTYTIFTT